MLSDVFNFCGVVVLVMVTEFIVTACLYGTCALALHGLFILFGADKTEDEECDAMDEGDE